MRMRCLLSLNTCSTMESTRDELGLDRSQVKKAVHALQAYLKSTASSQKLFMNEGQPISLLFTLWKIPKKEQTVRIPLPNGLRTESGEVCLFTRDEPNMTSEQTEKFYKKLLSERAVKNVTEVIPFKVLRTEYKPFEAKRRLLANFDLFLADARIRRRLPSHIGKHFYERKKSPLSVDLESKHLARDMERLIQGTTLCVSKKGSCCMARVAHSGMTADEIVENVVTAVSTISTKLETKGKNIKIIHLKSPTSVALPIYTSDLSHLALIEEAQKKANLSKQAQKRKVENVKKVVSEKIPKEMEAENNSEEEIPQLVPIEMPTKKPKQEEIPRKGLQVPKPAAGKVKKIGKEKKMAKKTKVTALGMKRKAKNK
ncbi:ribosomal L1 domain-containing protein 1-like [Myxocyprinus asiaticus]|uniref:ribosomal L1 domain-containing protein 1-like n=1 Tax=Myxocyprinus asiaticus TaxID=70543 RepID=UPI0022221059|nr:ribosomal L1 domain-containing protein 1-like [Myxocyprinus asiaticus]